ncbi:hypothetical protein [Helicobacter kayseriensis]|uniref:hypothetical protein n=1 Tax=Helicobacter kayseriensis TaxID=2905877 RepID=UPI001E2E25CA|nr:hypothetical protein [Helicobacter kayseriensis]MCE3046906.1 hypothetical protein [Helicobacter kayseriensis]MCE3048434.1 hypothetical protein [Helicobacter kayseriensis]
MDKSGWIIPTISFCGFVITMIVVVYLSFNQKLSFDSKPSDSNKQIVNLEDFKKALIYR